MFAALLSVVQSNSKFDSQLVLFPSITFSSNPCSYLQLSETAIYWLEQLEGMVVISESYFAEQEYVFLYSHR